MSISKASIRLALPLALLVLALGNSFRAQAAGGPVYAWHTFYGSSTWDYGYGMAADGDGNLYITGESGASWNGPGGQAPLHPYTSGDDIFVLKLNSSGAYQWHTFYGGDDESGEGIALDGSGNVYVCGNSNASWNGPAGQAPLNPHSGDADMLILKLNAGGAYQWHAYYGNPTSDDCFDIAVRNGSLAITGFSGLGWNGPNAAPPLHGLTGYGDMTLVKLNTSGAYQWHTFYGGNSSLTSGYGVDIDSLGNITAVGESAATWPLVTPPIHAYTGSKDIFAVQVNSAGAYRWHTFYGSAADDSANDVVVDGSNNLILAGSSDATWNAPAAPLTAYAGGASDMAIVKLNANGIHQWHTFHGSTAFDSGEGIDVDANGLLYVTGYKDVDFNYFGNAEIWVSRLGGQGVLLDTLTYPSSAFDIAVDQNGNIYVAGDSSHTWDQAGGIAPLHAHSGSDELIVIKTQTTPASFADVPPSHWAWNYIERLYNAGVTGGCGGGNYCPSAIVTRDQMAVFLESSMNAPGFAPPPASGSVFLDVPANHWAAAWIEQLAADSVTGGCGNGNYCPARPVTRDQMAVFLLRARHGPLYTPPAVGGGTGFADVPVDFWAAAWIKQLAAEGITGGCGGGNYCPTKSVTRDQMAVFLVKTFDLP